MRTIGRKHPRRLAVYVTLTAVIAASCGQIGEDDLRGGTVLSFSLDTSAVASHVNYDNYDEGFPESIRAILQAYTSNVLNLPVETTIHSPTSLELHIPYLEDRYPERDATNLRQHFSETGSLSFAVTYSSYAAGNNTCQWARDGVCDEPSYCPRGTDATDCQSQGTLTAETPNAFDFGVEQLEFAESVDGRLRLRLQSSVLNRLNELVSAGRAVRLEASYADNALEWSDVALDDYGILTEFNGTYSRYSDLALVTALELVKVHGGITLVALHEYEPLMFHPDGSKYPW